MNIKEFGTFCEAFQKAIDPEPLENAVSALIDECREASRIAREAADKYFSDAEEKKARAGIKISSLQKQVADDREKLKLAITASAVAPEGDDEHKRLAGEISSLKAAVSSADTDIEILQSAYIRGDEALYRDALSKNEAMIELKKTVKKLMRPLGSGGLLYGDTSAKDYGRLAEDGTLAKTIRTLMSLQNRCSNASGIDADGVLGSGADMEKLDAHYNAEKIAAERKKETEERAARSEQPTVQHGHSSQERARPSYSEADAKRLSDRVLEEIDARNSGGSSRSRDSNTLIDYASTLDYKPASASGNDVNGNADGDSYKGKLMEDYTEAEFRAFTKKAENDQKLENLLAAAKNILVKKGTTGDEDLDLYIENLTFEALKEDNKNYVENKETEKLIKSHKIYPKTSDAKKHSESRATSHTQARTTKTAVRAGNNNRTTNTDSKKSSKVDQALKRYYENEAPEDMRESFEWFIERGLDVSTAHNAVANANKCYTTL